VCARVIAQSLAWRAQEEVEEEEVERDGSIACLAASPSSPQMPATHPPKAVSIEAAPVTIKPPVASINTGSVPYSPDDVYITKL
jgi:hypothetical protein